MQVAYILNANEELFSNFNFKCKGRNNFIINQRVVRDRYSLVEKVFKKNMTDKEKGID